MSDQNLSAVHERVLSIARASTLGHHLTDVRIEVAHDDFGGDFLRVILPLGPLRKVDRRDALRLIGAIEEGLREIDPRYPSVRFAAAA